MALFEIRYTKENLKRIEKKGYTWWSIHSDEHPSGKEHIGYISDDGCIVCDKIIDRNLRPRSKYCSYTCKGKFNRK